MQLKFLMALYHYIMVIGPTRNITNDDIVNGDTLLDIIDEGIKNKSEQDKTTEVLLNDFHFLLNSLGREDITYETEDEIVTRKALEEKENFGLKERFMKVRTFMTERCAKIPFFGKRLLSEMQSELGENQLQEAIENENMDR